MEPWDQLSSSENSKMRVATPVRHLLSALTFRLNSRSRQMARLGSTVKPLRARQYCWRPAALGVEVREALDRRAAFLVGEGFGEHQSNGVRFKPGLIETLQRRELEAFGKKLSAETKLTFAPSKSGEHVSGTYRQRFALASGRFAMIDNGLGFQLVPWSHALEKYLGKQVSGIAR